MKRITVRAGEIAFSYDAPDFPNYPYEGNRFVVHRHLNRGPNGETWYSVWDKQKQMPAATSHWFYGKVERAKSERDRLSAG